MIGNNLYRRLTPVFNVNMLLDPMPQPSSSSLSGTHQPYAVNPGCLLSSIRISYRGLNTFFVYRSPCYNRPSSSPWHGTPRAADCRSMAQKTIHIIIVTAAVSIANPFSFCMCRCPCCGLRSSLPLSKVNSPYGVNPGALLSPI